MGVQVRPPSDEVEHHFLPGHSSGSSPALEPRMISSSLPSDSSLRSSSTSPRVEVRRGRKIGSEVCQR